MPPSATSEGPAEPAAKAPVFGAAALHDAETQRKRAQLLGHDMRAAVTDILGGLSLADLGPLDDASRLQLERVRSAAAQLSRLTDETLAFCTGDAPALRGDRPTFPLVPFLCDIANRWTAHAREKGLSFTFDWSEDLPATIGTDLTALERILSNLLGNAIKHAGAGSICMTADMGPCESLVLGVRDSGPGFSDEALARLFEYQGRPENGAKPGSGLGLHIVRDLAAGIGAQMQVANHSGGALVSLSLPRAAWAPGVTAPAAARELPDLTGQRVLVAEDSPTSQLLIGQMLDRLGAEYALAEDGRAALDALDQGGFDLGLIDIEMPQLSGIDVMQALRARGGASADTPILAITAFVLSANRQEIYAAGADGILAKPIMSLESFAEAIARVLEKRTQRPEADPAPPQVGFDQLHLDRLLAISGPAAGRELLERLQDDLGAVEAGLREGILRADLAQLRARTHVLISLAGAVGAEAVQSGAEALNAAAQRRDDRRIASLGPALADRVGRLTAALAEEYERRYREPAT
ncbi:two-component system aerobic respiration control sensor histidine kinase ArcB [Rhodovulum iodosum]|uniref:histidine kinase n=1 Tax=Rhodovulum iodosum TaxID=68291 RepID=A0ABV3XZ26_9RHOB|nr:response regulator [Rhodovulum robiginosum]